MANAGDRRDYWRNCWSVAVDEGEGPTIAEFEYPTHAVLFANALTESLSLAGPFVMVKP